MADEKIAGHNGHEPSHRSHSRQSRPHVSLCTYSSTLTAEESAQREPCITCTAASSQQHDSGFHNRATADNRNMETGHDRDNNVVSMSIGSKE